MKVLYAEGRQLRADASQRKMGWHGHWAGPLFVVPSCLVEGFVDGAVEQRPSRSRLRMLTTEQARTERKQIQTVS